MLVCPKREVKRVADLTAEEISDLWITAQKVGSRLECHHKASSLTFTIQASLLQLDSNFNVIHGFSHFSVVVSFILDIHHVVWNVV